MSRKWSLLERYRKLNFWSKFSFWSSIVTLIGLPISIVSLILTVLGLGATPTIISVITRPVTVGLFLAFAVLAVILLYKSLRQILFVAGLKHVPDAQQALLVKAEYAAVQPDTITAEERRRADRDWYFFVFAFLAVVAVVLILDTYLKGEAEHYHEEAERQTVEVQRQRDEAARQTAEVERQRIEAARLRERIEKQTAKLDTTVDREKRLLILAATASGRASVIAQEFPTQQVRELAENLKNLVSQFEAVVDKSQLSDEDLLLIRAAKARVANVEGRYQDALAFVSDADTAAERKRTEAQIKREYEIVHIRAKSYTGLHEWEKALASYNRMVELRPKEFSGRNGKPTCLYHLGRLNGALTAWTELLTELTNAYKHGSPELGLDVAVCFANRSGALADLGHFNEARVEASVAIDMMKKLVARQPALSRVHLDLARTLVRRAGLHADLQDVDSSLEDFRIAFQLLDRLEEHRRLAEGDAVRASMLHDRATVLFDSGKEKAAVADLDKAIDLLARMAKQSSQPQVSQELAISLIARGTIHSATGNESAAEADLDRAIELLKPESAVGNHDDRSFHLATAYHQRAVLFRSRDAWTKAEKDLLTALELLAEVRKRADRPAVACETAKVWMTCADILLGLAVRVRKDREKLASRAAHDYLQAALVYESLSKISPSLLRYKEGLALSLYGRMKALALLHQPTEAVKNGEKACALLKELPSHFRPPDNQRRFAQCVIETGFAMAESGQVQKGVERINEGIDVQRTLIKNGEKTVRADLASALQLRGRALGNHHEPQRAAKDLDESISLFEQLIRQEDRKDLQSHLDRSKRHRRELAEGKPLRDLP